MRQRFKRTTATIVGSSNVVRAKASQAILRNGHTKRVEAISQMEFTVTNPKVIKHYGRPYVMIWNKKVYIPKNKVEATVGCGMKVYFE